MVQNMVFVAHYLKNKIMMQESSKILKSFKEVL